MVEINKLNNISLGASGSEDHPIDHQNLRKWKTFEEMVCPIGESHH